MSSYGNYTLEIKGRELERYVVKEKIWQGATSTVYKGTNNLNSGKYGNVVAIKILHPYRKEPLQIKMFRREALIQQKFDHPNIVKTYSYGRAGNIYFILMEYVNGFNLKAFSTSNPPPERTFEMMFKELAESFHCIHQNNIVHNDIKPENIIYDYTSKSFKITDFGYAGYLKKWFKKPMPAGGTEHYMAPERKNGVSDARSDIYSFGILMREYLLRESAEENLKKIVSKATQEDPQKRYFSFSELAMDLENHIKKS